MGGARRQRTEVVTSMRRYWVHSSPIGAGQTNSGQRGLSLLVLSGSPRLVVFN